LGGAGPTVQVTTTAAQRLTGTAEASIGLGVNGEKFADLDLCYRQAGGGALINFAGANPVNHHFLGGIGFPYSAAGSVVPGAGTWVVGMCIRNPGAGPI